MEVPYIRLNPTPAFSDEVIRAALGMPPAAYAEYSRVNTHPELGGSTALLYLLLVEKYLPGVYPEVLPRIMENIRSLLTPGHEPAMKVGPIWGHPMTASALTLAKKNPSVWNALSDEEQEKADWVMRAFCVMCAWATSDQNDYWTGPCLAGNYRKSWNPNHRSPNVIPIIMASIYFGSAEAVDRILTGFSYDVFTEAFRRLGFTNILRTWTPAGKDLFEHGGACFLPGNGAPVPAGEGKGVRYPYRYCGTSLSEPQALLNRLLRQNTHGGKVVNEVKGEHGERAYLDNGSSPVLGLEGMMSEFSSCDAQGIRSDVIYCAANFCILIPSLAAAVALGVWNPNDPENREISRLTAVGVTDFLYKIQHGYHSFAKGKEHFHTEKDAHGGYLFAKDIWNCLFT